MKIKELIAQLQEKDPESEIYDYDYQHDVWFPMSNPITDPVNPRFEVGAEPEGPWIGI